LSVSTTFTGLYEPLAYLITSALSAACAAYLVRRYLKMREKLTWLFIAFFAVLSAFFFCNFLVVEDILQLNMHAMIVLTFLIAAGITSTIGLVMVGVKQLYALPALIVAVALFHQLTVESSIAETRILFEVFSYGFTGQFIGNPWYITLKSIFQNFVPIGQSGSLIPTNILYDPLVVLIPDEFPISIYLAAIVIPTTILFYILAWKNRSGRSLGFALGLTTYIIMGFGFAFQGNVRSLPGMGLIIIATTFFALGIIGVLDRLMKKKESPKKQVKKEKT